MYSDKPLVSSCFAIVGTVTRTCRKYCQGNENNELRSNEYCASSAPLHDLADAAQTDATSSR